MPSANQSARDLAPNLAVRLTETLQRERTVPRFVDSYVVEHGRYGLQVHAALYRDLLNLLHREALLAMSARALEIVTMESRPTAKSKPRPMLRKEAAALRRKYLAALTRQQRWNVGDALDFQRDLQMYEELITRNGSARRSRKPFEVANHPFVDRCAFLLDASFLEKARLAASRALTDLEQLADRVLAELIQGQQSPSSHRQC
jgi:hypothetical protein